MKYKRKAKKFYKRYETIVIVSVVIFGLLGAASIYGMSSFSTSGIWDASVEITGISIDGEYTSYNSINNVIDKSKTKITLEPDGTPTRDAIVADKSMNADGLKPQVEVTVGSLFHVDEDGKSIKDSGPNFIEDVDGVRYVHYYLGFSVSLLTRSSHLVLTPEVLAFDYYGQTIHLYEIPNFAGITLGADIGLTLAKQDGTVPTECGVQSFEILSYETRYTTAESQNEPSDVTVFNSQYDWLNYHHEGSIEEPDEYNMYSYYDLDAEYSGKVFIESTLVPGSEYAPTWSWNYMDGGTFNVWDVELLTHYMCEVVLTYEIAADTAGYLEDRLDIGGTEEPEVYDLWYYLTLFFNDILNWIMDLLGINDLWLALAALLVIIIGIIVTIFMFKKMAFNRVKTRTIYGY